MINVFCFPEDNLKVQAIYDKHKTKVQAIYDKHKIEKCFLYQNYI